MRIAVERPIFPRFLNIPGCWEPDGYDVLSSDVDDHEIIDCSPDKVNEDNHARTVIFMTVNDVGEKSEKNSKEYVNEGDSIHFKISSNNNNEYREIVSKIFKQFF